MGFLEDKFSLWLKFVWRLGTPLLLRASKSGEIHLFRFEEGHPECISP